MIRLVLVELRRYFARPLMRIVAILALGGILVGATIALFRSHPPDEFLAAQLEKKEKRIEACLEGGRRLPRGIPESEKENFCRYNTGPFVVDPRWHLTDLENIFLGTSPFLIIAGWLLGASFIGAEWNSRNLETTLTWEPRRLRLLAAKAAALALATAVGAVALQLVLGLAMVPAALRGTTAGADAAWLLDTTEMSLRVALVSSIAAVIGFSIAALGHGTAAALGAGFAYLAIVESLVRAWKPQWFRWLITDNAVTLLTGESPGVVGFAGRTMGAAAIVLVVYALVVMAAAMWWFNTRDVL